MCTVVLIVEHRKSDLPSFWYSSIVFFSPTLKPGVCSGSSWSAMVIGCGVCGVM